MDRQIDCKPSDSQIESVIEIFKLLADRTRLKIMWELLHNECSVNELSEEIGANAAAVSQHLGKLRLAKLVNSRRQGNKIYYSAKNDHVLDLIEQAFYEADHLVNSTPDHFDSTKIKDSGSIDRVQ